MILNLNKEYKTILLAYIFAVSAIFALSLFQELLTIFIFIPLYLIGRKKIPFSTWAAGFIFIFLVVTSDISEILRLSITLIIFIALCHNFLKEYGIKFKKIPSIPHSIFNFVILTIISLILSIFFSISWSAGFPYLIKQIIFFIIIYTFYNSLKNENDIHKYILAMVSGSLIVSFSIIYVFLTTDFAIYSLRVLGFAISGGYFSNVAAAGGILTVTITLNFYLFFTTDKKNSNKRILLILSIFIQIVALMLTNSRAAFLGSIVSLLVFLFSFSKTSKVKLLGSLVIVVSLLLIIFPGLIEAFLIFIRAHRIFENPRYYLWSVSFDIIADNPFFGIGPGTFGQYMYKYIPVMLESWDANDFGRIYNDASVGHSHNFIFFRIAELGILGLFTALLLPYLFYKYTLKVKKELKKTNKKAHLLVLAIFSIGTGLFARSIFESTGLLSHGWITRDLPFWILFAIVIYYHERNIPKI